MKKISLLAVVAVFAATSAGANVRPYIGTSDITDPFNNAVIGVGFGDFRVEGNFSYDRVSPKDGDTTGHMNVGVTGFYDINIGGPVTPFVGAGISRLMREEMGEDPMTFDTIYGSATSYNVQAGVAYEVITGFNLDVALKYERSHFHK